MKNLTSVTQSEEYDYILVRQGRNYNNKRINVRNIKWFDCEYFVIKDDGFSLRFTKCDFDPPKIAHKLTTNFDLTTVSDIELGNYYVNTEESTENELIVTYNK